MRKSTRSFACVVALLGLAACNGDLVDPAGRDSNANIRAVNGVGGADLPISCTSVLSRQSATGTLCVANDRTDLVVSLVADSALKLSRILLLARIGGTSWSVPETPEETPPLGLQWRRAAFPQGVRSWSVRIPLAELGDANGKTAIVGIVAVLRDANSRQVRVAKGLAVHTLTTSPATVTSLGSEGGVVRGLENSPLQGVVFTLPRGAVEAQTLVVLTQGDSIRFDSALAAGSIGGSRVGRAVEVKLSVAQLAIPAQLTIPVDLGGRSAADALRGVLIVHVPDSGLAEILSSDTTSDAESPLQIYDEVNGTLSVAVSRFSVFAPTIPASLANRTKAIANIACPPGGNQLNGYVIDDQAKLGSVPRVSPVKAIVVHSTASGRYDALSSVIGWTYNPNPNCDGLPCPAHYYIDKDGSTYRLVAENYVALHARDTRQPPEFGSNLNAVSIGIELFQRGANRLPQDGGPIVYDKPPYEEAQYTSLKLLLQGLLDRYPGAKIIYHSDVNPIRKIDPQEFDRSRLSNLPMCVTGSTDITFAVTGTINLVTDNSNVLPGQFSSAYGIGTPLSAEFTFDPATPDQFPLLPSNGTYALKSASMTVGQNAPVLFKQQPSNYIAIESFRGGASDDYYYVNFNNGTQAILGADATRLYSLGLRVTPGVGVFPTDALLLTPPDLSLFSIGFGTRVQQLGVCPNGAGASPCATLLATITSFVRK